MTPPDPAPPPPAPPAAAAPTREAGQAARALAEERCATESPSCDWIATLSGLERASVARALAARGYVIEPAPWGKVIGQIRVYNEAVFAEPVALLQFFNYFHVTTKESVIRDELVVAPGERWDQKRIDETARRLRDPLWSSVVAVVPVQAAAPGIVDVLVVTRDIWSLRLNTQYTFQQGKLTNLSMSLSENNFFGTRSVIAAQFTMDQGAIAVGPLFIDKNLLGKRLELRAQASTILTREDLTGDREFNSEGTQSAFSLIRPLWSLASKWGWGSSFSHRYAIDRQFRGTALRTFNYEDPETMTVVPFERQYEMRRWSASAYVTRQWGGELKHRVSVGHSVDRQRPRPLDDFAGDAAARAAFIENVLPRSEVASMPFVEYIAFTPRYSTLRNVATFALAEDLRTGPDVDVSVGFALELLGSDRNFQRIAADGGWTFPWARDGFLRLGAAYGTRVEAGELIDSNATGLVRAAAPPVGGIRFLAQTSLSTRWKNTQNQFFAIGSDTGLRGFGINEFIGQRYFSTQIEARTLPYSLWVLRIGGVAFYDLGSAAVSLAQMELHQDAGLGLRVLMPQISAQLWKFDFAVPFDGANRGRLRFIAGFGSEF